MKAAGRFHRPTARTAIGLCVATAVGLCVWAAVTLVEPSRTAEPLSPHVAQAGRATSASPLPNLTPRALKQLGGLPGGPLLAGGSPSTLEDAPGQADLAVVLPAASTMPSNSTVTEVWVRKEPPRAIYVQLASDMAVKYQVWGETLDVKVSPQDHWQTLIDEGIDGKITTVEGTAAFVVPSSPMSIGNIQLVLDNGEWVNIYGNGHQTDADLEAMAKSVIDQR